MFFGDGQLVDFWRCVAVRLPVGQAALLYQQFGDLLCAADLGRKFIGVKGKGGE